MYNTKRKHACLILTIFAVVILRDMTEIVTGYFDKTLQRQSFD